MARAHLNRPVLDQFGNLVTGVSVQVYEPGSTTLIAESIFLTEAATTPQTQPLSVVDGIISIYLAVPKRVRLGVRKTGSAEVFYEDIDVLTPDAPGATVLPVTDPETGEATTFVPSFSLQTIVSGALTVANNIAKPGLRVIKASTAKVLVAHIQTPPTGSALIIHFYRVNGGTATTLGDVTVAAGSGAGSTAISVDCAKGDMIRFDVTQIGSTVAGSDINLAVDFA